MKYVSILLCSMLVISACKNDKDADELQDTVTIVVPDSLLVYQVDAEAKTKKRFSEIPADSIKIEYVINGLNQKYPEVNIQLMKLSNDTLYVQFADGGEYLGERMGSAGSAAYMADAVLNLTGVNGVNYVKFEVQRHSHVSPTVLDKNNFDEFKEIK